MTNRLRAIATLALLLIPAVTLADTDAKKPDVKAPIRSWTAIQQWMPVNFGIGSARDDYGYSKLMGGLLLADELGDHLSELGRASMLDVCFSKQKESTESMLPWAVCQSDVKALDLKKLEAELTAAGGDKTFVLGRVKETREKAEKIGAAIEAVKTDPGVQQILKVAEAARSEWTAYAATNKADVDRYLALKDAVRSGKSNHPAFTGCHEATRPAFAKVLKAALPKIPWDVGDDYMDGYLSHIITNKESFIVTVSFAACLWSQHDSATGFFRSAANGGKGGTIAGPRSLALSRLLDPDFKPKFADRSMSFNRTTSGTGGGTVDWAGAPGSIAESSNAGGSFDGVIGTMTAKDDMTMVKFNGEMIEACLQWKSNGKVTNVSPSGSVSYDKDCVKRGKIPNEVGSGEVFTKFLTGIKPGMNLSIAQGFPIVAWKAKKLTALLTIPLP